jgi:hypothetical protein
MAFARCFALALGALVLCGLAAAGPAAARTNYALIVAVTDYENFSKRLWLKGPNNDLVLAYNFLTGIEGAGAFSPENIHLLMTPHNDTQRAIAGANTTIPTRDAILNALADIAQLAVEGDFVFLHLGGHGSQQLNVADPNETDGKDEVFLPYDAGAPTAGADGVSHYPNAITDNDFAMALNAIRAKGADVWAVFDFCHSGSVTRGEEIDRRLDMVADFGVSPEVAPAADEEVSRTLSAPLDVRELEGAPNTPGSTAVPLAPGVGDRGSLVAFFAAQNSEPTKEKPFIDEATQLALPYGIFSRALYGALATNRHPEMSYRQLADAIFQTYLGWNRTTPTPMFEGALDVAVMGTDVSNPKMQWIVKVEDGRITVPAGRLHGVTEGARLLALPSPVAEAEDAIGVFEVARVDALKSTLTLQPGDGVVADPAALPPGTFARLASVDYSFALAVARPETTGSADPAEVARVNAALEEIAADPSGQLRLAIVEAGAPEADVRLAVMSNVEAAQRDGGPVPSGSPAPTLVIMDDTIEATFARLGTPPQMTFATAADGTPFEARLRDNLTAIYRAMGLARLAGASTFAPDAFDLSFAVQRGGTDTVEPIGTQAQMNLWPDDALYVGFTNRTQAPVDLNILYLETDYEIKHVCRVRVGAKESMFEPLIQLFPEDIGNERLIAVVTEARDRRQEDLAYLAQTGLTRAAELPAGGIAGLLAELGDGSLERGDLLTATAASKDPLGAIVALPMTIVPLPDGRIAKMQPPLPLSNGPAQTSVCTRD